MKFNSKEILSNALQRSENNYLFRVANIMEKDQFAMYDLLDSIIESLTPDQLNQIEDVIVNQYGEN